jgi:oxygen-independent coproporphyrinogen-3 oxidase
MALGIYISVPFCRSKCSYCNFASDVFSHAVFEKYVYRVCEDIDRSSETALAMAGKMELTVDSIYLGGGTPTVLETAQLERIFASVRRRFEVNANAEITVECAPGTLSGEMLETLLRCGVNRVSLGVQSFVDQEAAAVGRLHKREAVLQDISRLRRSGITNLNLDLIAGLPHQTPQSWEFSLAEAMATGAPHLSVYMLEVDEDSRLGSELLAGGARYHAHFVPEEEAVADFYLVACERLQTAGIAQYEISNFARAGCESRHNLKYWTRQPYFGFGVDAHSFLGSALSKVNAVRFASPESLEQYTKGADRSRTPVSADSALEESFFLGLRLNRGVSLRGLADQFGEEAVDRSGRAIAELVGEGLIEKNEDAVRLTARGRLLSNEVFGRLLVEDQVES